MCVQADQVDRYIQSEMKKFKIPGLTLAIVKNGKIIKINSYGVANIELNAPTKNSTVYQVGSIGKQFTATLIMMLVAEEKISLDDKISKYLQNAPAYWDKVTIRNLLTHTSGIKNDEFILEGEKYNPTRWYVDPQLSYTDDELIKLAGASPLEFQPGEKWNYSNTGYILLGIIAKKVTGKSRGDLTQELIFEPLKMNTAGTINRSKIIPNRASGYLLKNGVLINSKYVSPSLSITADGGLYMTALDLAKWDAALYTDQPLKQVNLNIMWTPVKLNNGKTQNYGFGWIVDNINGHRVIEHGGEFQGFSSYITRYPDDKFTVIILTNLHFIAKAALGPMTHHIADMYKIDR